MRATDLSERIKQLHAIRRVFVQSARLHGIPDLDIFADRRNGRANEARTVAYWVAHRRCGYTYKAIGMAVDRDHSTVLHAVKRLDTEILNNPAVHEAVEKLAEALGDDLPAVAPPPLPKIVPPVVKANAVVPAETLPEKQRVYVPSAETIRDVGRLRRLGWSYNGISRQLGVSVPIVQAIIDDMESQARRSA